MGSHIFRIFGDQKIQVCRDLKIERFTTTLSLTNLLVHFRMT